jgi:hypothetical protein
MGLNVGPWALNQFRQEFGQFNVSGAGKEGHLMLGIKPGREIRPGCLVTILIVGAEIFGLIETAWA